MSDFVLIPVEPTRVALDALPDTHDLVKYACHFGRDGRPAVIGYILNKADRRREQYKLHFPPILEAATKGTLPPVFDNLIPDTPALATAMDGTQDFHTLKGRYDTYYDQVRRVARELEERCEQHRLTSQNGAAGGYGDWLRGLYSSYWPRERRVKVG